MNNWLHVIGLILCLGWKCITSQIASIPVKVTDDGQVLAELSIGSPPQRVLLKVLTASTEVIVKNQKHSDSGYNPIRSNTVYYSSSSGKKIVYQGQKITLQMLQDNFNFGQSTLDRITFGLINDDEFPMNFDGILGLGYESLLLNLIKDVKPKAFAIQVLKSSNSSLFFGDFNHLINEKNKKLYSTCPMNVQNKQSFNCFVDSVYINMNNGITHHKIRQEVAFNMGTSAIIMSKEFFEDLVQNFFNKLIDEDICLVKSSGTLRYISCRGNQKRRVEGKLSFVLGKRSITLDLLDLYAWQLGFKISRFVYDVSSPSQWTFGTPLLTKYTIIFNKEDSQLGFIKNME